jgi:hypothetical protein
MFRIVAAAVSAIALLSTAPGGAGPEPPSITFTNIARSAGLDMETVFGDRDRNTYLVETTGTGVAMIDYDGDGWIDLFFVKGSSFDRAAKPLPTNHLYRNKGNRTFEDVTAATGLADGGWGQGACVGDYDNDGHDDLFVTGWGSLHLYHNEAGARFRDVTEAAGMRAAPETWSTSCAFIDYDRDGRLDLFVARYIDFDIAATPRPASGLCRYRGLPVACGPPGLPGGRNVLYRNRGNGTFEDVSERARIAPAGGTYALGVSTLDFDNDGWTDLYVADDSSPSVLYRNNHDGTFADVAAGAGCAYSEDGRAQAGMGVAVGDYDRDGRMDIFKTNFAGDTSTLYRNAGGTCEDRTFAAGLGINTRWLGWGTAFVDFDNDGWLDLFLANGHVYPEVRQLNAEAGYEQPKVFYRNRGDGRFEDATARIGAPLTERKAARGAAFGDIDNDGRVDVAIANVNDRPDLYRVSGGPPRHYVELKLQGTASNRDAIGARVHLVVGGPVRLEQWQEVRGGGSYLSQNDFRVHFGLDTAAALDRIEVRWPNGREERWEHLPVDRLHVLREGDGR